LIAATVAAFGRVDILVANAGVGYSGSMAQMPEEQIVTMVQVNLFGVLRCVRAVLPVMLAQGRGHVITVSSVAAGIAGPGAAVYAATKAAVHRFSEGLRREVQPRGVFVTDVLPGFIDMPMGAGAEGLPKAPPATVARAI